MMTILQNKTPLKIPLRFVLAIPLILAIVLTTSIVGYIALINGQKAVNDVAHQLSSEVSARVDEHLHNFLIVPLQVNQFNTDSMQQGWLDPKDIKRTQDYFLEQVKIHKTITSIYFGNADGGIVGGGREGATESFYVYNTENLKAGAFNKYAITDTGQVGKLLTSVPNFDTRTRPWYIHATQKGAITWNDIYVLITGQDMTIALSSPVYDQQHNLLGVLSVEIFVSQIENFMETLKISETGQSFIMERSGLLIASSSEENSFIKNNDKMERLDARNSQSPMIKYAAESLRERFGENYDITTDGQFDFEINGKRCFANVSPVHDQYGIDWLIVVVIPESDFTAEITATYQSTFLVTILALGISILASIFGAGKIASRISHLNKSTRAFAKGERTDLVSANSRISEIDELTNSFTEMEHQLTQTLNDLKSEVSERKTIGQALHESESLFRAIFEQAAVGVAQIETATGRFVRVNQKYCDIVGYSRAEMEKMNFQTITHAGDLEVDLANMELLKAGEIREFTMEKRYFRKSGEPIWVSLTASPMWSAGKMPNDHVAIVQDVTERKQAEEALQESEARAQAMLSAIPDLMFRVDRQGIFLDYKADISDLYAQSESTIIGKRNRDISPPEFADLIDLKIRATLETGTLQTFDYKLPIPGKGVRDYEARMVPGGADEVMTIVRDITGRKQTEEELQKLANVVNYSSELVNLSTLDGNMIFLNEAGSKILGISPAEVEQTNIMQVIPTHFKKMVENELLPALLNTGNWIGDLQYMNLKTGQLTDVHATTFVVKDQITGAPLYLANVSLNITERKQAEEELRQADAKYRNIFENTIDGIFQTTPAGKFFTANPALARMLGYDSPEELIAGLNNLNSEFYVQPTRREEFMRLLSDYGMISDFESEVRHKDGSTIWISENAKTVCNDLGQILYYEGTLEDITARKQAEDRLRQSEEQYRILFNHLPIPAFTKDINGIYTSCNEENLKYWATDPVGHTDAEVSPNKIALALHANDQRAIESGKMVITDELLKNTPMGDRLFITHKVPLRDGSGNIIGILGASLDITERKRIEDEMLEKSKELEALFTISSHLRTAQTAGDMLPVVLAQMSQVLNADANAVILLNPDQTRFTYAIGDGLLASNTGLQFDVENSISGHIMQARQPYVTLDYANDPLKLKSRAVRDSEGIGPMVMVPLQSETEFIGTLLCARAQDSRIGPFTPAEVQLLVSIGEMVGNALRRARLYDDALSRLHRVQGLRSIDSFINANMDIKNTLNLVVNQTLTLMNVDAAAILYYDQNLHMLEYAAAQGFHYKGIEKTRFELVNAFSEKAILERRVIIASDLSEIQDPVHKELMQKEGFVACYITPMIAKGKTLGVLELYKRAPLHPNQEWLDFHEAIGAQAAIAIDNARLFHNLQTSNFELMMAYDATIQGWSHALELKDSETEGHTLRVTETTVGIAKLAGLSEKEITRVRRGALLHDIGKMGIPDHILNKTSKLSSKEWDIIRQHPQYAYDMLHSIEFLRPALDIPYYHHEKWDGTGYPQGLRDLQIPYAARLFAVIDVWDALTSDRIYRKAWPKKKVFAHIKEQSGKHFDPQVVGLFLKFMNNLAVRKK